MSDSKTILFFGFFDEEYSRNRVLIKGAKDLGYTVMLCKVNPRKYGSVFVKGRFLDCIASIWGSHCGSIFCFH